MSAEPIDAGFIKWTIRQPKRFLWTPQTDITAYELAQCLPALMMRGGYPEDYIPQGCERHFTEQKP
jgi:hypothetical protein